MANEVVSEGLKGEARRLWWQKHIKVSSPGVITQPKVLATTEIVRGNIETMVAETGQRLEHLNKLSLVTEGRLGVDHEKVALLKDRGFRWFVKPQFIAKFKYHACLLGDNAGGFPTIGWSGAAPYTDHLYIGDIPDTVLDKILCVKDIGIRYVTIHSMQPLPVAYHHTDPVAVGWFANPHISLYEFTHGDPANAVWNPCLAFVIAVWDGDKEQEVL